MNYPSSRGYRSRIARTWRQALPFNNQPRRNRNPQRELITLCLGLHHLDSLRPSRRLFIAKLQRYEQRARTGR
jgi:hypothetical protein